MIIKHSSKIRLVGIPGVMLQPGVGYGIFFILFEFILVFCALLITCQIAAYTETWKLFVVSLPLFVCFVSRCMEYNHVCICIFIESVQTGEFEEGSHPAVQNETS